MNDAEARELETIRALVEYTWKQENIDSIRADIREYVERITGEVRELSTRMVRSLTTLNRRPCRPTRSWMKKPLVPVSQVATSQLGMMSQKVSSSPPPEANISKPRFSAAWVRVNPDCKLLDVAILVWQDYKRDRCLVMANQKSLKVANL